MHDLNGYEPVHAVIATVNNKVFKGKFVKLVALKDSDFAFIKSDQIQLDSGDIGQADDFAFKRAAEIEGILITEFQLKGGSQVLAYSLTSEIKIENATEE